MSRDLILGWSVAFGWAGLLGIAPTVLPLAYAGSAVAASTLLGIAVYRVLRQRAATRQAESLHAKRGISAVSCGRNRAEEFAQPWEIATEHIQCWGVGMTNIVRDAALIEAAARRGCTITFEMIDPVWLRNRPELCALLDVTYHRSSLVDQIDEALKRLIDLRDRINEKYGADTVQILAVQHYQAQSGTVSDPASANAVGYIEHHTMGFPNGQSRIKAVMYDSPKPNTEPPYLHCVLESRMQLPHLRVGKGPTDREQRGWLSGAEDSDPSSTGQ